MATFLYNTRGNSSPERKPRVFFTCHPEDFSKYFEKICENIFKTHDCAIFYTEDLNEEIEEKYKESDLGQMNLFVIPITFKLLSQPNRAMDSDFRYAKEKHIPVLPIMMEPGLDELYSQNDKFGELQYLNSFAHDLTAISYEEKLNKYLESVLIGDEMAERIRKAFDAYIFLSYRKKDRHYANELMKMIHSHPEFRDIAIWYDEFLTPGESFCENIEHMMKDSKLFTLLVTPNLLEYIDGQPNYVMAHEYPDAKKAGMDIIPTEMEETDKDELCSKFDGIPECVRPDEDEAFKKRLADTLSRIAVSANNDDPEHNFLIGLAYLDGIDVEINKERGVALITFAAETGLVEAMEKLYDLYAYAEINHQLALMWAQRCYDYYKNKYGTSHLNTQNWLVSIAYIYNMLGMHKKALNIQESFCKSYDISKLISDTVPPSVIKMFANLSYSYVELGKPKEALEIQQHIYDYLCRTQGENHETTLLILGNMAVSYSKIGNNEKALEIEECLYSLETKYLGCEHPSTITTLGNLACTYSSLGKKEEECEAYEKLYYTRCKILGKDHYKTLNALIKWIWSLDNYKKGLDLLKNEHIKKHKELSRCAKIIKRQYAFFQFVLCTILILKKMKHKIISKIFGKTHKKTLVAFSKLSYWLGECGYHEDAIKAYKELYEIYCSISEEKSPPAAVTLHNIAWSYSEIDDIKNAINYYEMAYLIKCETLGEEAESTQKTLSRLNKMKEKRNT